MTMMMMMNADGAGMVGWANTQNSLWGGIAGPLLPNLAKKTEPFCGSEVMDRGNGSKAKERNSFRKSSLGNTYYENKMFH